MEKRKELEAKLHDTLREEKLSLSPQEYAYLSSNKKFYSVARASEKYYQDWLRVRCSGKNVLDYCCGNGKNTIFAAKHGAKSVGIDISGVSIENCKKAARQEGVLNHANFLVMDAENLTFPDNYFDVIICAGVLHHLDIHKAFAELSRVLAPAGEVICIEALTHNPAIHYYRKKTPHLRTEWETEHILSRKEIILASTYFNETKVRFYHLFSLCAVPFRNSCVFSPLLHILEALDVLVLRLPVVKWWAWQAVIILAKPKKLSNV